MKKYINNIGEEVEFASLDSLEYVLKQAAIELSQDVENEIALQVVELPTDYQEVGLVEFDRMLGNIGDLAYFLTELSQFIKLGYDFRSKEWVLGKLGDWGYTVYYLEDNIYSMDVHEKYAYVMRNGIMSDIYENNLGGLYEAFNTIDEHRDVLHRALDIILVNDYRSRNPYFLWIGFEFKSLSEDEANDYLDSKILRAALQ